MIRRLPTGLLASGIVLALTVVAGSLGWLPLVVVVAVLYLVPGYLLVSAIFGPLSMPRTERLVVSVAMSVVFIALGAQVLNLTPLGITAVGWIVLMILLVVLAAVVALRRDAPEPPPRPMPRLDVTRRDIQLLVAASLVSLLAIVVAAQGASLPVEGGFTEMWIEERGAAQVELTVRSQELEPMVYRIHIDGGTETVDETVELDPGATWSTAVDLAAGAEEVSATLFRDGEADPYRQVRLVVDGETT